MNLPNMIELYCYTAAESPNSGTVARHRRHKHVSSAANDRYLKSAGAVGGGVVCTVRAEVM
jgi:hypothetical protein